MSHVMRKIAILESIQSLFFELCGVLGFRENGISLTFLDQYNIFRIMGVPTLYIAVPIRSLNINRLSFWGSVGSIQTDSFTFRFAYKIARDFNF